MGSARKGWHAARKGLKILHLLADDDPASRVADEHASEHLAVGLDDGGEHGQGSLPRNLTRGRTWAL